ncbi:hypothetical protein [Martelella mediterranea]|uniref:Uncharacterized protein n=1 Tax=Martelella mediterranea TaxID=293089 RepID=A0A4R3NPM0_9HYPH|nr:hypothetical protein [Martelella mediterranea]TCT34642.1 hypothetical protein EDC90_103336 [Martelella mediterranea]
MTNLFGGKSGAGDLRKQQEANQRRQLADMARQQAEVDQSTSGKAGRKTGSRLLTFLSGNGVDTLGGA